MVRRPGYLPTPGLLRRIRTLGGRARRQRLKRAFPGLAAGGEAVRSGGRVSVSDHRHRDNGLRCSGPAGFVRARRRRWASDTATRALAIAAIGSPPSSRASHPAGRGPARVTARADARGASSPAATRPASFAGSPPPRGRSVPRWVPASSPPRERSFVPFQIVGNVVGARPPPPHRPASPRSPRGSRFESPGIVHDQSSGATNTPRRSPTRCPRRPTLRNPRAVAGRRCSSNLSEAIGRSIARRRRKRRLTSIVPTSRTTHRITRRLLPRRFPCYHGSAGRSGTPVSVCLLCIPRGGDPSLSGSTSDARSPGSLAASC
jgi:hypothetical protein